MTCGGFSEEVSAGAGLHADEISLEIGCKLQKLGSGAALPDRNLAPFVQSNQVKHRLAERYLGTEQSLVSAVNDGLGLDLG